jgi:hypothetical protein
MICSDEGACVRSQTRNRRARRGGLVHVGVGVSILPGVCGLAFMARLYGGPAEVFLLAEFEEPIPELRRPIVLLVDYVNHKIERPTIEESAIESARKNRSA